MAPKRIRVGGAHHNEIGTSNGKGKETTPVVEDVPIIPRGKNRNSDEVAQGYFSTHCITCS
ncbi:hypothetical protein GOP47_0002457 [Adiantum capillus-veneris]|uniref:Uncharacterized protein n=1 Tax=Adiantum capillus-veneris TaxID=13818 RepID=A0A9D4VAY9_ADICA|nr:hypothetical protein GOP47_0002457 [Adiantum capillus-veneris]